MRLTEVPGRALAVFAHPDDHEMACGGTLAAWSAAGSEIGVVVVNAGDKGSSDPGTDPQELTTRRRAEMDAAAALLGVVVEALGLPDGEVENSVGLRAELVAAIRRWRPEVLICPDPTARFFGDSYVNHHDHRVVGEAALDACAPMAASPLYFPEAGAAHAVPTVLLAGTLEPDCWVDVAATLDVKARALACHHSQLGDDDDLASELVAARAEQAGAAAAKAGVPGLRHAEGFRRLRLA